MGLDNTIINPNNLFIIEVTKLPLKIDNDDMTLWQLQLNLLQVSLMKINGSAHLNGLIANWGYYNNTVYLVNSYSIFSMFWIFAI